LAQKENHRNNLVRTAMRLFRRQGYAASGLQQILAESGAPRGSLYHYFPQGKDGLAEAAVNLAGDLVAEMLEGHLQRTRTLRTFLGRVVETYAGWMVEGGFASGCPIATTMLECAPASAAVTAAGERAFRRWIAIVAAAFERDGHDEATAARNAAAFVAAIQGALILSRVMRSAQPLMEVASIFPAAGPGLGKHPAGPSRLLAN
jgi:TetR/AcrR family transcriptional repressor of lmrAB and yxaGH operons